MNIPVKNLRNFEKLFLKGWVLFPWSCFCHTALTRDVLYQLAPRQWNSKICFSGNVWTVLNIPCLSQKIMKDVCALKFSLLIAWIKIESLYFKNCFLIEKIQTLFTKDLIQIDLTVQISIKTASYDTNNRRKYFALIKEKERRFSIIAFLTSVSQTI